MAITDLTTLAAVKQYAQTTGTGQVVDDPLISSLISAASQMALNFLSRPSILSLRHTDIFTGTGGRFMGNIRPFRYQPVTAVYGVKINGSVVPAIPSTTAPNRSVCPFD